MCKTGTLTACISLSPLITKVIKLMVKTLIFIRVETAIDRVGNNLLIALPRQRLRYSVRSAFFAEMRE